MTDHSLAPPRAAATAAAQSDSWALTTTSGITLHLPPSMRSLSTYVLLEQERWFEPEMSLLPLLLQPGDNTLDIGANHGLYTLELARCTGHGHVWAFEPTSAPRTRLMHSVAQAGLGGRVTVVDAALADIEGQASFAVHDNSELNSRAGADAGARREQVRLTALDTYLRTHAPDVPVAFVKLDAEGDELRVLAGGSRFFAEQSPVVLFEYKHGGVDNTALLQAWTERGYALFRWSTELSLLLPFDPVTAEGTLALNLVAVRPASQQPLADRGLLVLPEEWAGMQAGQAGAARPTVGPAVMTAALTAALQAWCAQPAVQGPGDGLAVAPAGDPYADALALVALAHAGAAVPAALRAAAMLAAREAIAALTAAGAPQGVETWVLLVHCMHALGEPHAAVQLGRRVLAQWPASGGRVVQPVVPPLLADLQRRRSTAAGPWLEQVLKEFVATQGVYSSYFGAASPERWAALLVHPDHDVGIERRYLLSHVLCDRVAAVEPLRLLARGEGLNVFLWQGLIKTMAAMAPEAAAPAADSACAAAPQQTSAADVLAALPVATVRVVDVGASSLGHETEPYAPLVRAGRASVVGFEPDAAALQELQRRAGTAPTHRYLPHFVGNGAPGVFHAMQWSLTASLLPPHRAQLDRYHALGSLVQESARYPVQTVRLDDVIEAGGMDLLKIDVQGGELQVFDGAPARLSECLVVWTEVEMLPLYEGQPLFADIDARLRQHGLQFMCFTGLATRALASWPASGAPAPRRQQQLWADAIYVPHPERIAQLSADAAARLALLAHYVVDACDLCHAALLRVDALCGSSFADAYLAALAAGR